MNVKSGGKHNYFKVTKSVTYKNSWRKLIAKKLVHFVRIKYAGFTASLHKRRACV